jgi:hypothetical protein
MALSGSEINKRIESLIATKTIYAQGLWYVMRRIIEHPENKRPGYLWHEGRDIRAEDLAGDPVNASPKMAPRALRGLRKLVLTVKGTRKGEPAKEYALIKLDGKRVIYSPALIYLHERLNKKAEHKAESEARKSERGLRNPGDGGVTGASNPPVTPVGSAPSLSPPSLSPTTPLTTTPSPSPTSRSSGGASPPPEGRRAKAEAKYPPGEFRALTDFWQAQYLAVEGIALKFQPSDAVHLAAIFTTVGFDLDKTKAVIAAYFRERERFYEGHPVSLLRKHVHRFVTRALRGANGESHGAANGNEQHDAYAIPDARRGRTRVAEGEPTGTGGRS